MDRPKQFEDNRWVGDKRDQVAHDVDHCSAPDVIEELMDAGTFTCWGPDSLVEARNRGYHGCQRCDGARDAAREADEVSEPADA